MTDEPVITIAEPIFRSYISALRKAADETQALRQELHAIGAIQTEDGQWLYPFYMVGGERYLPRQMWITACRRVGEAIKQLPPE